MAGRAPRGEGRGRPAGEQRVNGRDRAASVNAAAARCARCEAPLGERQRWCLRCGAAARTAIAPTPRWAARTAAAILVLALALALAGVGYALATLLDG